MKRRHKVVIVLSALVAYLLGFSLGQTGAESLILERMHHIDGQVTECLGGEVIYYPREHVTNCERSEDDALIYYHDCQTNTIRFGPLWMLDTCDEWVSRL